MKNYKFNNIFCLIVLAISLIVIGAFIAMHKWTEVISNSLFVLLLVAILLRWHYLVKKEKELDEHEKRLDGLSEHILPIAVGAALFAGLHMGKDDKDGPEPEKKDPDPGQPASSAAANEETEMGHIAEGVGSESE